MKKDNELIIMQRIYNQLIQFEIPARRRILEWIGKKLISTELGMATASTQISYPQPYFEVSERLLNVSEESKMENSK